MFGWLLRRPADPQQAAQAVERAMHALAEGRPDDAARLLERAIAADPSHAAAHANLGALRRDQGRLDEAERLLSQALELQPALSEATWNLALLRLDRRQWNQAQQLLRTYIGIRPREAEAHYWLGNALAGQGDMAAARVAYAAAVRFDPQHARARWGVAMAQLEAVPAGAHEQAAGIGAFARELESVATWCRKQARADGVEAVGAQQPFFLAYAEEDHRALLERHGTLCTELMGRWARKAKLPAVAARGSGKLKVGIVSAHVHSHSVWHAIVRGWLEYLDPARFDLQVFHTGSMRDAQTRWADAHTGRLVQGVGPWTAWAGLIADAQLDVLLYPEIGMDATTLRLASLRLARVQLASWGHPITTGLPTIDGYLSAEAFEPGGADRHYSERLITLPRLGCACRAYGTAAQSQDLSAWGISAHDRLLVAPGVAAKYSPLHDALWVEIARRCAPARLVFFRGEPGHWERLEARLRAQFDAAGMDFDATVRPIPWQSQAAWFGLLRRADVFLDTPGFSGFNTALQAIECATPIVAWEGRFMRGRFASGILRALGLSEWIASTHADYVERVVRLAGDEHLRSDLRRQIQARRGALFDDRDAVAALGSKLLELAGGG